MDICHRFRLYFVIFRTRWRKVWPVKETSQNWMVLLLHSRKENKWKETFSVYRRSIFTRTTPVKKYLGRELLRWPDSIFFPPPRSPHVASNFQEICFLISKDFASPRWYKDGFENISALTKRIFLLSRSRLGENIIKCI